jgi:hypothetical protein
MVFIAWEALRNPWRAAALPDTNVTGSIQRERAAGALMGPIAVEAQLANSGALRVSMDPVPGRCRAHPRVRVRAPALSDIRAKATIFRPRVSRAVPGSFALEEHPSLFRTCRGRAAPVTAEWYTVAPQCLRQYVEHGIQIACLEIAGLPCTRGSARAIRSHFSPP